nr:hypothetical protein [Tanacetum cinerariifolium]
METSEEEEVNFDPIPRTPEDSEKKSDDEEEQKSRLKNLPTFNSAFCFEERLRLLETSLNEYRQTNQVAGANPEWFSQPRKPPSPDRAWNPTLPAAQGGAQ